MAASFYKWLMLGILGVFHPFFVSVTEINHNAKDKTLEISCKIFTNDFEAALEKTNHFKTDLSQPKDKKTADKLVSGYIQKHLQLKADGKPVNLEFVGSEKETDATWSYFQVSNIATVKKIDITNNLLYETFEGQINLMHVTVSGNRQSTKLSNPETNAVFDF